MLALGLVIVLSGCGETPDWDPAAGTGPSRGVAVDIFLEQPASDELTDLDAAAALGVDSVRVGLQWTQMEPLSKGQYDMDYLKRLDDLIARARERDIQVLLTPVFTPCWAAPPPPEPAAACADPALASALARRPPVELGDYATFVAFLAARYDSALAGIEIWNEPNLSGFWVSDNPAEDYAALLKATYPVVKQAAPGVPIVGGVLAGGDAMFLRELYDAGITGSYDVLSLHLYNDDRAPEVGLAPQFAKATLLQGMRNTRTVLAEENESRPVWITEIGWNTSTQTGGLFLDGVTPQQQADYLEEAIALLQDPSKGIDFASALYVYRLRDIGTNLADPQHNYGLMGNDRQPKPALDAVRRSFERPFGSRVPSP